MNEWISIEIDKNSLQLKVKREKIYWLLGGFPKNQEGSSLGKHVFFVNTN